MPTVSGSSSRSRCRRYVLPVGEQSPAIVECRTPEPSRLVESVEGGYREVAARLKDVREALDLVGVGSNAALTGLGERLGALNGTLESSIGEQGKLRTSLDQLVQVGSEQLELERYLAGRPFSKQVSDAFKGAQIARPVPASGSSRKEGPETEKPN